VGLVEESVMAEQQQLRVDTAEAEAAARYLRGRQMSKLLGDVIRRADAHSRLETALRLHPGPS